jgi:hypothetical protein
LFGFFSVVVKKIFIFLDSFLYILHNIYVRLFPPGDNITYSGTRLHGALPAGLGVGQARVQIIQVYGELFQVPIRKPGSL